MIGWLQGIVRDKSQGKIVLDVNGVGYDVELSLTSIFQLEQFNTKLIALHIHTLVREDAFILYGFWEKQERTLFRTLIKVNGIGPRAAMNILSHASYDEFIHHIMSQNKDFLIKLPGIGKKTAERLLIELKDAFESSEYDAENTMFKISNPKITVVADEAVLALVSLGYKQQEACKIIKKLDDGSASVESLIRGALKHLTV